MDRIRGEGSRALTDNGHTTMAYLTITEARLAFRRAQASDPLRKNAATVLNESVRTARAGTRYDIFLSHSFPDAEVIAGVKALLEEQGLTVYVDWIEDRQLDRSRVTTEGADLLRTRMRQSLSMLFATSDTSPNSKWMPWELGYFDGLRHGRVAVLPLVEREGQDFVGQEYLGLYPTVEELALKSGGKGIFVTPGAARREYMSLQGFRDGRTQYSRY